MGSLSPRARRERRSPAIGAACMAVSSCATAARISLSSSTSRVRISRSMSCRTPPSAASAAAAAGTWAKLMHSPARSAGRWGSLQARICFMRYAGTSVFASEALPLSSTERLYRMRSSSVVCDRRRRRPTSLESRGEANMAAREPTSKERLYTRRSAVASTSAMGWDRQDASAETRRLSRSAGRFSLKMESFLRKTSASTLSSGLSLSSIAVSNPTMPFLPILRSISASSARLRSTWKHTYRSFSCLRTCILCRFSLSLSAARSPPAAASLSFARSRSRMSCRLHSRPIIDRICDPTAAETRCGWNCVKDEKAKRMYSTLMARSCDLRPSSLSRRASSPTRASF
mmetsp:Transcript_15437/g.50388  ORF Transcript_15437/g.50388 Transcript_15437/m.50388 type:complete len:344 (-) Transcript_15437:586-1617(-)